MAGDRALVSDVYGLAADPGDEVPGCERIISRSLLEASDRLEAHVADRPFDDLFQAQHSDGSRAGDRIFRDPGHDSWPRGARCALAPAIPSALIGAHSPVRSAWECWIANASKKTCTGWSEATSARSSCSKRCGQWDARARCRQRRSQSCHALSPAA